ncbi:MAG: hypothetical protein PHS37_08590 [Candidatus Omnitrophica bacterium]|nr:hypothetical protein [Candidatus Omnitrophota bacterium]
MKFCLSVFFFVFMVTQSDTGFAVGNPNAMKAKGSKRPAGSAGTVQAPRRAANPAAVSAPVGIASMDIDDVEVLEEPVPEAPGPAVPGELISGEATIKLVEEMRSSSAAWPTLSTVTKEGLVMYFISAYKKEGAVIKKPAAYYVKLIDQMAAQKQALLSTGLDRLLRTVAVMEYDFDNGEDKDTLAKSVLGEAAYQRNKARFVEK